MFCTNLTSKQHLFQKNQHLGYFRTFYRVRRTQNLPFPHHKPLLMYFRYLHNAPHIPQKRIFSILNHFQFNLCREPFMSWTSSQLPPLHKPSLLHTSTSLSPWLPHTPYFHTTKLLLDRSLSILYSILRKISLNPSYPIHPSRGTFMIQGNSRYSMD